MEKTIKLTMDTNKTLTILLNNEEKHSIYSSDRSINAEKIYEILDYNNGDNYEVIFENKENTDIQVLEFFIEMFKEIVNKVNELPVYEDI